MAKKAAKKKPAGRPVSRAEISAREIRDDLRRIKNLELAVARETRAVERAHNAATLRLQRLMSIYVEREGLVMVDRAAWETIKDERLLFKDAVAELEAKLQLAHEDELGGKVAR